MKILRSRPRRRLCRLHRRVEQPGVHYTIGRMRTLQLTFIALLTACDPDALRPERAQASPSEPAEQSKSLAVCLHSCDDGDSSPTDRATCRLNCETTFKVTPTADVDDGFTRATRCLQSCRGADANTCREACRTAAGAPVGAPLERLEQCVDSCGADATLSDTNRATCDLTCTQEARRIAGVRN
jgi:hypothetical protein